MAAPAAAASASVSRGGITVAGGPSLPHAAANDQPQTAAAATATATTATTTDSNTGVNSTGDYRQGHGHFFTKKNFHRPTHCHHCMEVVWGLLGQGYVCEVCNFVCHDRCLKTVISSCTSIAFSTLKNPVPHCWSEPGHFRRKFCYVCRKRLDDNIGVRCEICEYYVHVDCQDFVNVNCKDCATYVPNKDLPSVRNYHHWREGNLPGNSKCIRCKKTCWSSEYLTGMRCEWCGATAHPACFTKFTEECDFGCLGSIMLPPSSVSIPRTDLPMEAIIGIQTRRKEAMSPRSISDEFSSTGDLKSKDNDENQVTTSSKDKERDEEVIKVYDGNSSMRRRMFRIITVSKNASRDDILSAALRSFYIADDPNNYYVTDAYSSEETELLATSPIPALTRYENRRPAIFLRFHNAESDSGRIRVYPGRLKVADVYKNLQITSRSTVDDVILASLDKFGLDQSESNFYKLTQVTLEKGTVHERSMDKDELPWEILKNIGKESIRQMEMTRFYLQQQEDPHGSNIALFVGNLPPKLSQRQYEKILVDIVGKENKFNSIGPIYYEYGSLVITFTNSEIAIKVFYLLRESSFEDKNLLVLLLPNVMQDMIPEGVRPLLIFVNVKSGGCQGQELISSFRKLLNPYQVFDLENGGPLPGLYVFRFIKDYKILACGGDGTVGWVLQCLDNVGQDSVCQSPACAIVPLGTGNDLARVLRWGPGFTGCEDPLSVLKDIIDAEEIRLDRWTVVFHFDEKPEDKPSFAQTGSGSTSEDNTAIFVMNNYFGIGIDADLCLDFHNAREENPNKFNSRLRNKGVYVKMGLRKMVSRKSWKDLHREVRLEVDGKVVDLPPVEGIIILNILSWGSGANPWGPEREDQFARPTHYDGMLEVVGVTGVVHMGQILSGMRSAIRIAQGGHLRIRLNTDMPVQVDGEPWIQSPGEVVVLRSALKATMLKKIKGKIKRRNTEPSMLVAGVEPTSTAAADNATGGPF